MRNKMKKLVVLGPALTYSSLAADQLNKKYEKEYVNTILECGLAIGENQDALMPFENTLDGFIMETMDSFIQNSFYIKEQVKMSVNFHFASTAANMEDIKQVYVQHKAYGQCLQFITKYHLKPFITQSNIESLMLLNDNKDQQFGAIVPSHIDVSSYPTHLLNVADSTKNETRFIRISSVPSYEYKTNQLCGSFILYPLEDRAGLLYTILEAFKKYQLNLKSILSRPRKDRMGHYVFYIEVELNQKSIDYISFIKEDLMNENVHLKCIGIYDELEEK